MRSRTSCLRCLRAVMSFVLQPAFGTRAPRDRGPPDTGAVHCSLVPRGQLSPLPPLGRPAWTADQKVRRGEPAVAPTIHSAPVTRHVAEVRTLLARGASSARV